MDSVVEDALRSDEARLKTVVDGLRFSVSDWVGPLHDPQRYRRIIWRASVRDFLWQQTSSYCLVCPPLLQSTYRHYLLQARLSIHKKRDRTAICVSCLQHIIALPNPASLLQQYGGLRQEEER
jgi:hypothetical protein